MHTFSQAVRQPLPPTVVDPGAEESTAHVNDGEKGNNAPTDD